MKRLDYFNETSNFNLKKVNIRVAISEMYPRIPMGTARGSLGIRGANVGNQWTRQLPILNIKKKRGALI